MTLRWSATVFARNEAASLHGCLRALERAGTGADLHVTVLLNGSTDGSAVIAGRAMRDAGLRGGVWDVAHGDKANAFNQFVHRLRPRADIHFFVDGYAAVAPDALHRLAGRLRETPQAQAAAAVPSVGRSAARLRAGMIEAPGLHGSLFALRETFVARIAAAQLRLPIGFYRGDGLIGSFVLHDLDAASGGWIGSRIVVDADATWTMATPRGAHWRDAKRHWNRLVQQGRGRLQWAAIRDAIYPGGFGALPCDADSATLAWIAAAPAARRPSLWRDPFAALAASRMAAAPSGEALLPRLISTCA